MESSMTARDWTATARDLESRWVMGSSNPSDVEAIAAALEAAYAAGQADKEAEMCADDDVPTGEAPPLTAEEQRFLRDFLEKPDASD